MAELSKAIAQLMAEREAGQTPTAPAVDPTLGALRDSVRQHAAPSEQLLADAFVQHLFDKAGADLLAAGSGPRLAAAVLSLFRFVAAPTLEEPRVALLDLDGAHEGWEAPVTVLATCMRDRPFIVDTIRESLQHAGGVIRGMLHPVFTIRRDPLGAAFTVAPPGAYGRQESVVYVELDGVADAEALRSGLTQRLAGVVHATDDYPAMRAKAQEAAALVRAQQSPPPWDTDGEESAAFLDWLGQKNFVFLGYREYQFAAPGSAGGAECTAAVRRGSGLGILRDEERSNYAMARRLPELLRSRLNGAPLLMVSKTNAESPIHRRAHMDYIGVKELDSAGQVVGERRFLGLFTSKANADEPTAVPLLRRRLAALLETEGAREDSHDYKAIVATFNSIPKVELLSATLSELDAELRAIFDIASGPPVGEARVWQRLDAFGRGAFVVVMVPRERFSDQLYRSVEAYLTAALAASAVLEQRLVIDAESPYVRMHFYCASATAAAVPAEELEAGVTNLLRTWDDRLRDATWERLHDRAPALAARYLAVFPSHYKAATAVGVAVRDIECLETLAATRTLQVDLSTDSDDQSRSALKLYLVDEELVLSDFLPVLENLGLKVFAEHPIAFTMPEIGCVRVHTFVVQDQTGARIDVATVAPRLAAALVMLHRGRIENDRLNALIVRTQLDWRQVDLLRAYVNYSAQISTASIGAAASRAAIVRALVSYPETARLLWKYFDAKFDSQPPAAAHERRATLLPVLERNYFASLDGVQSVADDRCLRAVFHAIAATVRTNFYAPAATTAAALAVKIDCTQLPDLRQPRPLYEMYVHAPHVDGIHLRGGRVARGGIRLSDRAEDFRTEIHDLMRTQTVKNAVIVPAGAKGGFVVKGARGAEPLPRPLSDTERGARGESISPPSLAGKGAGGLGSPVVAAYRTFISALLDLTDNVVQGRVAPPNGMLVYDDPDPYLVVAADKGTSAFSDIANEVAAQHQFWLGDAFASGGTHGYDHKKEGITARGAWECVRRHCREMGGDADSDPLTVIGIGDMSGDVFGNGLLLSPHLRLRAAFNHQHIFVDPDPDVVRAFAERQRLFHLPRAGWADYDPAALGPGGGVYPRAAKEVPLSAAARAMLGRAAGPDNDGFGAALSGEEVVQAILRMDADLLWNGGIGTYVKASDETHAEVGDSANDAVRVNAADLRVKLVAEGGNLGCTQRGRIEYALRGGRINTDAIDNSAGVDLSDHEVNLKIALAPAVESGQLSRADRNQLLSEVTSEVTQRVLSHNRSQARTLSLDQRRSQTRLADFRDLMAQLETDGGFDRRAAHLPDRDALRNRRRQFLGLTRPELAVLLAHSKLALRRQLLESALPDDPYFEADLRWYFPERIDLRFGHGVRRHRLRRDIISVELANRVTNAMGAAFVSRVQRDTGAAAAAVVRAWVVAVTVSGVGEVWDAIADADPPLSPEAEARCWCAAAAGVERAVHWIVATQPHDQPATPLADALTAALRELPPLLPKVMPAAARDQRAAAVAGLVADGAPSALAERIVGLDPLADVFEIAQIAIDAAVSRSMAAEAYYRVGEVADLEWVRRRLDELPGEDRWDRRAIAGLTTALIHARRRLTHNVLACRGAGVDARLQEYLARHQPQLTALGALVGDIKSAPRASLAALLVAVHVIGRTAETPA